MVDFPGRLAVLMFTCGCDFRCGFCHNAQLIGDLHAKTYSYRALREKMLRYHEDWVSAVSITGGEPTLQPALPETLRFFKDLGFQLKLDTNGAHPEVLENVLPLVDYVAMDIKCALEHYPERVHFNHPERIRASIRLIIDRAPDYEFRTTVLEPWHTDAEILAAAHELKGARRWLFQPYLPHDDIPDPELAKIPRTRPSVLEHCASLARPFVQSASAR